MGGTTAVTAIAAPIAVQLTLLSTPLFVIGLLGLAKTGFSMLFGRLVICYLNLTL
jgi:hypothetical protein